MLEEIVISAKKAIECAENSDNLQQIKVLYLGKSGFITEEMKKLGLKFKNKSKVKLKKTNENEMEIDLMGGKHDFLINKKSNISNELIDWVFNQTIQAVEIVLNNEDESFINKFSERAQEAIDTNNKVEAEILIAEIEKEKQLKLVFA